MNDVGQRDRVVVGIQLRCLDVHDLSQELLERRESSLRCERETFLDHHGLDLSIHQRRDHGVRVRADPYGLIQKRIVLPTKRVAVATLRFLAQLRGMADDEHLEVRPRGLRRQHRFDNARQFLAKVVPQFPDARIPPVRLVLEVSRDRIDQARTGLELSVFQALVHLAHESRAWERPVPSIADNSATFGPISLPRRAASLLDPCAASSLAARRRNWLHRSAGCG